MQVSPRPVAVGPASGPSRGPVVVMVVLAVLVVLVVGFVGVRELVAPVAQVTREPVATAGANPFMPSVGTDQMAVRTVAHVGGRFTGSTPGLYGGSGDDRVCDRSQLTRYLGAHPDKAAGWGAVLGVRPADIDTYVASLTPVVLRSDTFVTNHGWHDGEVTSYPSVLQAGTAVLVDGYGSPVVRCFCGNPLSAPASFHSVSYIGPMWVSFSSTNISVVTNTTSITNQYTLVDVHTGQGYARPSGTEGGSDRRVGPVGSPLDGGAGATPGTLGTPGTPGTSATDPSAGDPSSSGSESSSGSDPSTGTSGASSTTTPADAATVLTSGTWKASGCPTLTGSVSFSGGSYTASGGTGGAYTLSGSTVTLAPSTTAASTATSTAAGSESGSAAGSGAGSSTSSAPSSSATGTGDVTLTLSTTTTPATASGSGCTLTHTAS